MRRLVPPVTISDEDAFHIDHLAVLLRKRAVTCVCVCGCPPIGERTVHCRVELVASGIPGCDDLNATMDLLVTVRGSPDS
jgi:hypothetical protein